MKRYIILYTHFLRFSFSKALHFRVDFRFIMDMIYYAVLLYFYDVIYEQAPNFGGWSKEQIRLFLASYFLIDALDMSIFANNLWMFPVNVNKGDLDIHLTRPINSLFFLSTKEFAASSFLNILFTLSFTIYAFHLIPQKVTFAATVLFALLILNGLFLFYIIHLLFLLPVFWTQGTRGFEELYHVSTKLLQNPEQIYASPLRFVLKFFIPLALINSVPVQLLFDFQWKNLGVLILISLICYTAVLKLWKLSLQKYQSASS